MTAPSKAADRAEAWGLPDAPVRRAKCKVVAAALVFGPALLAGIVGAIFWDALGLLPAAAALLVGYLILRTSGRGLEAGLAPRPISDARVANIVSGLSRDLGLDPPQTFVVRGEGPNAVVFRHRVPAIGLTRAAAEDYARTELEAVIAHCLVRLDPGGGSMDGTALALGGTLALCARGVTILDDARAAAVTRYPPALATAIAKAVPAGGRFGHLWFVADHPSHVPADARIAALSDL